MRARTCVRACINVCMCVGAARCSWDWSWEGRSMHTYHCNPVLGFSEAAWMPEPSLFLPTLLNLCQPCDLHSKSFPTHLWHLCCGIALVSKHGRGGWGGLPAPAPPPPAPAPPPPPPCLWRTACQSAGRCCDRMGQRWTPGSHPLRHL